MSDSSTPLQDTRAARPEFKLRYVPLLILGLLFDFATFAVGALISNFFFGLFITAVILVFAAAALGAFYLFLQALLQLL